MIHISQLATHFVRSPQDIVSIGDVVTVWVLSVDRDRKRIGLTMIAPDGAVAETARKSTPTTAHINRPNGSSKTEARTDRPRPENASGKSSNGETPESTGGPLRGFDELKQAWQNRPH